LSTCPRTRQFDSKGLTTTLLYVFKPPKTPQFEHLLLNSVEENKSFYTEQQFERAKLARDLYHSLGTPSINDFKAMLRMNVINNNPVTTDDIKIAKKIFGPDIGALKGKTTRRKPAPVVNDQIEIPQELISAQRKVTLCIDAMEVNGMVFLTTISKNLYYCTAQHVSHKTSAAYQEALSDVFRIYKDAIRQ
jgi:hypothetical protein